MKALVFLFMAVVLVCGCAHRQKAFDPIPPVPGEKIYPKGVVMLPITEEEAREVALAHAKYQDFAVQSVGMVEREGENRVVWLNRDGAGTCAFARVTISQFGKIVQWSLVCP